MKTPVTFQTDALIVSAERALRILFTNPAASKAYPATPEEGTARDGLPNPPLLSPREQRASGALMRVNHVGEVCAQAMYTAQAFSNPNPQLKVFLERARTEEADHLAWTRQRLTELGDRPSLLNPLWYASAFALGLVAGRFSDALSLGFVMETERQVEAHLRSHLDRLPAHDLTSRTIVKQMAQDEAGHGVQAAQLGGAELPLPVKRLMTIAAKVMTTVAHYV